MKRENAERLYSLCRRQRNRIWRERVVQRCTPVIACAAALLAGAAAIHQLWKPLNAATVLPLLIVPALLGCMVIALRLKPSERTGAIAADRSLHANSLLITAWELGQARGEASGTARLVLQRCEDAMSGWSLPDRPAQGNTGFVALVALTLVLAGTFFLWLPSHVHPDRPAANLAGSAAVEEASAHAETLGELLADARDAQIGRSGTAGVFPETGSPAGEQVAIPGATPADISGEPSSGTPAARLSGRDAEIIARTGDTEARDSAGASGAGIQAADRQAAISIPPSRFDRLEFIEIEAGSDSGPGASQPDLQAASLQTVQGGAEQPFQDRAESMQAGGISYQLSPLQRIVLRRYLATLDTIHDPKQ